LQFLYILSNSIDKTIIVWHLTRDDNAYGVPRRALTGHNHFVQDVVISSDGQFALSASWGKILSLFFFSSFSYFFSLNTPYVTISTIGAAKRLQYAILTRSNPNCTSF